MGAVHCEYVTDVMTFTLSRRFCSLSTSAAYGTGRLGRKTCFVKGFSASVSLG